MSLNASGTATQPLAIKPRSKQLAVEESFGLAKSCPTFRPAPPAAPQRRPTIAPSFDPPPFELPPSPPVTLQRLSSSGERKAIRSNGGLASSRRTQGEQLVCSISLPFSAPSSDGYLMGLTGASSPLGGLSDDMSSLGITSSSSGEPLTPSQLSTDNEDKHNTSITSNLSPSPLSSTSNSSASSRSSSSADLMPYTASSSSSSSARSSASSGIGQLLGHRSSGSISSIPVMHGVGPNGAPLTISPSASVDDRIVGSPDGGPSTPTIFSVMQSHNMSAPRSPVLLVGSVGGARRVGFSSRAKMGDGNSSNNSTPVTTHKSLKNGGGSSNDKRRSITNGDDDLQFAISLGRDQTLLNGATADFD